MANFRCNTCRGTYTSPTNTGSEYYHACPPLIVQEMKPLVGLNIYFCAGIGAASASLVIPGLGTRTVVSTGFVETMVQVNEYVVERTGRRDENVTIDPTTRQKTIKAAGTGATRL